MSNPILATDSYKFSHFKQYPPGTQIIRSYVEARGTNLVGVKEVVFYGLQAFINDYLTKPVTMADIDEAEAFVTKHGFDFNREGWERIVKLHGGLLPVHIQAIPEGTPVPLGVPMLWIQNTDATLPWVTSYVETVMLSYIWYGSTVATLSREIKKVIKGYLELTSDDPAAELPFKLHDFGYRGVAAGAAGLGGSAHLVNFMGSDTVAGIEFAQEHYNADVCGFSIPASEHSTMTSWGEASEFAAYKNMVAQYAKPGAIFACVIDSYDIDEALLLWAQEMDREEDYLTLLEQVKEAGATVVLRPDSGDAVQTPIDVIEKLMSYVGFDINEKGYKVLPKHVRVIQGDGIDIDDVRAILTLMQERGLSASNIAFGMGGGLLQKVNRDTFKFAMKACYAMINGEFRDVRKHPSGDASKMSKGGQVTAWRVGGKLVAGVEDKRPDGAGRMQACVPVYHRHSRANFFEKIDFNEVRKNAEVV